MGRARTAVARASCADRPSHRDRDRACFVARAFTGFSSSRAMTMARSRAGADARRGVTGRAISSETMDARNGGVRRESG